MDFFSDCDSVTESSCSDDQDEIELLYDGQACNILSSLEKSIGKIDDLLSFDRGFLYGDIVCSSHDPSAQMGRVIDVDISLDLENPRGRMLRDVNSKRITKIRSISPGDFVVQGPWVGKVDKIVDRVNILFDDGTKSSFVAIGPEKLVPISPNLLEDSQYPYYPGQRLRVELSSSFPKPAKWLCGSSWTEKCNEGHVCSVEAGIVYVDWISCAVFEGEKIPPSRIVEDLNCLTLLSCFSHTNWQPGDWCIFDRRKEENIRELFVISRMKTKVDVLWQDGSVTRGLENNGLNLMHVNVIDAHDFWPDQFILEKGTSDDLDIGDNRRWGVVRAVDAKERILSVKWKGKEELMEETISAYELVEHPEFSFSYGDVVFQIDVKREKTTDGDCVSSVGTVMGFKDGNVQVKWASGLTTEVTPNQIFRMDKYEVPFLSQIVQGENVEKVIQESNNQENESFHPIENSSTDSVACSLPRAALGIFTSILGGLFGSSQFTPLSDSSEHHSEDLREQAAPESFIELENLQQVEDVVYDEKAFLVSSSSDNLQAFKSFDMVTGCSDHHFFDCAGKEFPSSQVRRGWLKKIQQEWKILEKDIPETIFVRIYEERMDLLRAAIVGAPGTPYHDGLFFFDIFLPPDYPREPPMVHYNSGGLRLNPNLYESGKVCLSLLNTWAGSGTEVWNPDSSTILQVLLSLQALVLNEKPYYNEAGYDKHLGRAEGEKNSISYNENAFLVSCKSMIYLHRKPPKHFEDLVNEHFKTRGRHILSACETYMKGAPIGCDFTIKEDKSEYIKGSSTGFKIMLSKLIPLLAGEFGGEEGV
ncbi:probable ubiquitin-conjugating enzyme E2 24 [Impatiens glandulifera]|uniref:probable ubiquitin-conjugating enzyme E2 24 n=1 Tax=Impatiens glandulifera TaxID=253017 RepID=UPI001FB13ADF|nr:probable ubiquitin-conjugating enzyme E2 24 [Impatiens glandulifera]